MTKTLKELKLSASMRTVLIDLAEGRGTHHNVVGMSAHGGRNATLYGLIKRGLFDPKTQTLTPDGTAVVELLRLTATTALTTAELNLLNKLTGNPIRFYARDRRLATRLRALGLIAEYGAAWTLTAAGKNALTAGKA